MTRNERYEADRKIEAGVAKFLDENFYAVLEQKAPVTRWSDTQHQWAGVDITVNNVNFDEKIKIRGCLNIVYGYPSFEVQLNNRCNQIQDGWFIDKNHVTDYYAYIGVYAFTDDECSISDDNNISACDVLWVKKQDVVDMVEEQMTLEQLSGDAQQLREDYSFTGQRRKTYSHHKFWLTYSPYLNEKPVNLVTLRDNLEQLPHSKHFIVSREDSIKRV